MKLLLLTLLTFSAVSAFAGDCSNAQSTYDMKLCVDRNYQEQDKRLNKVYGELTKKLDKVAIEKLKKSQRAWISFRDAECDFVADEVRGGTMEGVVILSCLGDETKARADKLQEVVNFR